MWVRLVLLFLSTSALVTPQALAESFSFSAAAPLFGFSTSGVITATARNDGSYVATSISGTNITGLTGVGGFDNNDNLLFPYATASVDARGLAFTILLNGVTYNANISALSGLYSGFFYSTWSGIGIAPVTFQLQANASSQPVLGVVPEPPSLVLLGTGLLCLVGGLSLMPYRKRSSAIKAA